MIRPATPADALGIETVRVAGWQAAYPGLVPQWRLDGMDPAERAPFWERILGDPDRVSTVLVSTEAQGGISGFVSVGAVRDDELQDQGIEEVWAIYLHPSAWGTGVGNDLFSAGLDLLHSPTVTLWVLEGNARARRFYERHGFLPDGGTFGFEIPATAEPGSPVVHVPEIRLRRTSLGDRPS